MTICCLAPCWRSKLLVRRRLSPNHVVDAVAKPGACSNWCVGSSVTWRTPEQASEWRKKGELLSANLHRGPARTKQHHAPRLERRRRQHRTGTRSFFVTTRKHRTVLQTCPAWGSRVATPSWRVWRQHKPNYSHCNPSADEIATTLTWQQALQESTATWKRALDLDPACSNLAALWRLGRSCMAQDTSRAREKANEPQTATLLARSALHHRWKMGSPRRPQATPKMTSCRTASPTPMTSGCTLAACPGSHVILRMGRRNGQSAA